MEYIMINEKKLKVMFEQYDLERWNINIDALDYCNPSAKIVFDNILDHAKSEFGFDISGHRTLLQLYPSKDGGGELFITKLSAIDPAYPTPRATSDTNSNLAYSFEKLSYLLKVCKLLSLSDFCGESSAWIDESQKWYLLLTHKDASYESEFGILNPLSFILEYGESQNPKSLSLYLEEYAQAVCREKAVETLGKI